VAQLTAQAAAREPAVSRRLFWTLGLGAFGLAFSITTTAAYLPPLLDRFTDSGTLIGLVLGAEGVFALALSPVIGRGATRSTRRSGAGAHSCSPRCSRWGSASC